jgi:hypothetical protein
MFLLLIVAATLQASPAPAPAKPPAAPDGAVKVAAAPVADPAKDFICKTEEVTGTRFTKKVCRRKDEFEEKAREEQQRLRQMQRPQYSCQMSQLGAC